MTHEKFKDTRADSVEFMAVGLGVLDVDPTTSGNT